jgi:hypothetical protein
MGVYGRFKLSLKLATSSPSRSQLFENPKLDDNVSHPPVLFQIRCEAKELGLWYVVMSLLSLFGYEGKYNDRLTRVQEVKNTLVKIVSHIIVRQARLKAYLKEMEILNLIVPKVVLLAAQSSIYNLQNPIYDNPFFSVDIYVDIIDRLDQLGHETERPITISSLNTCLVL